MHRVMKVDAFTPQRIKKSFRISRTMILELITTCLICCSFNYVVGEEHNCTLYSPINITEHSRASIILTLINNAKNLLEDAKKYAVKSSCPVSEPQCNKPMDCADIFERDTLSLSGVRKIWPRSRILSNPINVYCDMEDDGGGWTVLQRRGDFDSPRDYFYRDWEAYKMGFGDFHRDFWLGNDKIFALTNQRSNIVKFSLSDWEGNTTYAIYDNFWIDDELHKYTMHISGYRGTAGNALYDISGIPFSTKDQDNDSYENSCAVTYKGAWWYTSCHSSNLNGQYLKGPHDSYADGVSWYNFRGYRYSLKDTVIKIRPRNFRTLITDMTP